MKKQDDLYEEFLASQSSRASGVGSAVLKLFALVLAWTLPIGVIELPLIGAVVDSQTCVGRTGDPSCVSVIEAGIFWQAIAIPLIVLVFWVLRDR